MDPSPVRESDLKLHIQHLVNMHPDILTLQDLPTVREFFLVSNPRKSVNLDPTYSEVGHWQDPTCSCLTAGKSLKSSETSA